MLEHLVALPVMGRLRFSCVFLSSIFCVSVTALTVYTENGVINGTVFKTSRGREVNAFLGIPFAKPPVLDLRFKEPHPLEKWDGIRPAHSFGPKCIQMIFENTSNEVLGDEDCLYLNIFTPIVSNTSMLDVVVYIHGGAFMFGSGDEYTPDYLLDYHDLVFVTINYRLGPFGFMTTEDGVIPGNIGLKDQVLALKWTQKNIEQFGGDRNKITIAGLSAGGASVHLHFFSPLSRNLFHQGISLSGSAFNPWALTENSRIKSNMLASAIGCPTDTSTNILECLKTRNAKDLILPIQRLFMPWNLSPLSPFGPVIENNSNSAFLSENPDRLLLKGDVKDAPWLIGMTTDEGLYPGALFIDSNNKLEDLDKEWNKIAPHLLDFNHTISRGQIDNVSDKIRKFYFKDSKVNADSRKVIVKMLSDRLFTSGIERAARLQASVTNSPVFFYNFGYRGKYSYSNLVSKSSDNLGVSHCDDILYILGTDFGLSPNETTDDRAMVDVMVRVWTSFVEGGVPSASEDCVWTPVSPDAAEGGNVSYLLISSPTNIQSRTSVDLGNINFWKTLPFDEPWNVVNKNERHIDEL